jgi:hypothetical protein
VISLSLPINHAEQHVAYIAESDFETLKETNTRLLENAMHAIERIAPNLKAIVLQTGGKG